MPQLHYFQTCLLIHTRPSMATTGTPSPGPMRPKASVLLSFVKLNDLRGHFDMILGHFLAYLAGVLHRDVSEDNVLLTDIEGTHS